MVDSCILERWVGDRKSGQKMVMVNDTNLKCIPKTVLSAEVFPYCKTCEIRVLYCLWLF